MGFFQNVNLKSYCLDRYTISQQANERLYYSLQPEAHRRQ
jgi:hypothetical protein